jgi:hypothetical protein
VVRVVTEQVSISDGRIHTVTSSSQDVPEIFPPTMASSPSDAENVGSLEKKRKGMCPIRRRPLRNNSSIRTQGEEEKG